MIIDTEVIRTGDAFTGRLEALKISYFNKEGNRDFIKLPLEQSRDGYVWEYTKGVLDKPDPTYRSWDDKPVRKVKTAKINKYTIEEILMRRRDEILPALEFNIPNKFILDIETEITDGFAAPELALNAVTSIAITNCADKKVTVFGLKDMTDMDHDKIQSDIDKHFAKFPNDKWAFRYIKMESEYDMLYTFFGKLIHKMSCITGWSVIDYDWQYLVNRADRIKVDPSMAGFLKGTKRLPQHTLIVDYLEIVKKWDRVIKIKENHKLDYIGEQATGIGKIKYPETLKDLYDKDFVKFIFYNAVDTILVHYIDQRLNTMATFFKLGHISQVDINKAFSPVWVQEALMTREFYRRNKVIIDIDKNNIEQKHFMGAYVKDPVTGLHEWVVCYDFASLYPNTIIQFNISPEVYLGKSMTGLVDEGQIICANGNIFDNREDSVLRTILIELYDHRKKTKGKMQSINKEVAYMKRYLQETL